MGCKIMPPCSHKPPMKLQKGPKRHPESHQKTHGWPKGMPRDAQSRIGTQKSPQKVPNRYPKRHPIDVPNKANTAHNMHSLCSTGHEDYQPKKIRALHTSRQRNHHESNKHKGKQPTTATRHSIARGPGGRGRSP